MHDAHCHVDQHPEPEKLARALETARIDTVAVTNLPSHYAMALEPLARFNHVRPALGLHPLLAERHCPELVAFERLARSANLIGEVGLDFSREAAGSKNAQLRSFRHVLKCLTGKQKFVSLHSRGAEKAVLAELQSFDVKPAVFHWFTGSIKDCESAVNHGHFFSVNISMLRSEKGRSLFERVPKDRVLTESDFPHVRLKGQSVSPLEIEQLQNAIADLWHIDREEAEQTLTRNFRSAGAEISSDEK